MGFSFKKLAKKIKKAVKKVGKVIAAPTKALAKAVEKVPGVGGSLSSALNAQASLTTGNVSQAVKSLSSSAVQGIPLAASVGMASGGAQYFNTLAQGAIPQGLKNVVSSVQDLTGKAQDLLGKGGAYAENIANTLANVRDSLPSNIVPSSAPPSGNMPQNEPEDFSSAPPSGGMAFGGGGGGGGGASMESDGGSPFDTKTLVIVGAVVVGALLLMRKR